LDEIPIELQVVDCYSQQEVHSGMAQSAYRSTMEQDTYELRDEKVLTLGMLRTDYGLNYINAFQYMRNFRARIALTDNDVYNHSDRLLVWNAGASYRLDYLCVVGGEIGLHAALSNSAVNLNYTFQLCPHPGKHFSGKYAQLGADQVGSMLHVGSCGPEEVFLYMCPSEVLNLPPGSPDIPPAGCCTGPTVLSPKHARVMTAFLAHCLSRMADVTTTFCVAPYEIPMPPQGMSWDFSNAL
jgi:hypothetical protein